MRKAVFTESDATNRNCSGFLHELCLSLCLRHLCQAMGTKRILRALRALFRTLCALGHGRYTRLRKRDRRQVRCETRDPNIMIAFCQKSFMSIYVIAGLSECGVGVEGVRVPRWSCKSLTSSVSPPRCFARRQPKLVTESMNSSAMSRRSCVRRRVGGDAKKKGGA